jgi:NADPH:quinone reductase-like Zn-dependent oxidoreductase
MLTTHGSAAPGETVLVQGAAGGVATAAVVLAKSMGLRVWVTSRDSGKRQWIVSKGADQAFAPDEELPAPVDLVVETVGEPTWNHSVGSVRAGGRIVVSGFTGGRTPEFDLLPLIVKALTIRGTLMGTATELAALSRFLVDSHARPIIDSVLPMTQTAVGLRRLEAGAVRGKVVIVPDRFL